MTHNTALFLLRMLSKRWHGAGGGGGGGEGTRGQQDSAGAWFTAHCGLQGPILLGEGRRRQAKAGEGRRLGEMPTLISLAMVSVRAYTCHWPYVISHSPSPIKELLRCDSWEVSSLSSFVLVLAIRGKRTIDSSCAPCSSKR